MTEFLFACLLYDLKVRETKAEGISAPYGSLSEDNSYQVAFAYGIYISHCLCFRDELSLLANSTAQDFHLYPLTNKEYLTLKKPIRVDIPICTDPRQLVPYRYVISRLFYKSGPCIFLSLDFILESIHWPVICLQCNPMLWKTNHWVQNEWRKGKINADIATRNNQNRLSYPQWRNFKVNNNSPCLLP